MPMKSTNTMGKVKKPHIGQKDTMNEMMPTSPQHVAKGIARGEYSSHSSCTFRMYLTHTTRYAATTTHSPKQINPSLKYPLCR
eukprot:CAMPEP_0185157228 /NCGR_PEP_ID=MMETSP1139-20130426/1638_1 /TAXON_ID=298111 /ORGANISM="Pavlova sp., Strain CCMP459" /LENGTH=82 /DNA_ID=CAMNT_0027722295 /DNA_START=686 /DNA_END=934 /DNA_ORIENTATION=-